MFEINPLVVVVNETSVLTASQAWNLAWACGYSIRWQFGPIWKVGADVQYLPKGVAVPSRAWILHLLDTADQEGALGYHDEDGNEVPYGRVFIKTAQDNGVAPSEVADHELKELLIDPHVNMTSWDEKSGRLFPTEVCDPAQGGTFDLGAPYGKNINMPMSDFVLPGWFDDNTPPHVQTSFRGVCSGPFSLGVAGYFSYTTTLPPQWEQIFGEKANKAVTFDNDDRVQRRLARGA